MRTIARASHRSAATGFAMLATVGRARMGEPRSIARKAAELSAGAREMCQRHEIRTIVSGEVPDEPVVLVANHSSYLDPIVIAPAIDCIPISKAEVAGWPVVGDALRAVGVVFVQRDDVHDRARVLRNALRILRSGTSILNFPEGTTTDGSHLLPFARGIFGIARIAGVPVVPLTIRYESQELCWTGNQTFFPHYWNVAGRASTTAYLHFGAAFAPKLVSGLSVSTAAETMAHELRGRIYQDARALERRILEKDLIHEPTERFRVSQPRADAVLSAAQRAFRGQTIP